MPKGKKTVAKTAPLDRARLFQMLVANPGLKTSELDKLLGAEQVDIRDALQEWELEGATHRTGRTRGTRWFVNAGASMPETLPPEAGQAKATKKAPKGAKKPAAPKKAVKSAAKKVTAKASQASKPARGRPKGGTGRAPQAAILDKHRALLGTVPDDVAAERTGVPARTIQYYRKKNGIAGYAGPKRRGNDAPVVKVAAAAKAAKSAKSAPEPKAAPTKKAAPVVASKRATGRSAWRVDLRSGAEVMQRFTFAASLTDAAALAAKAAGSLGAEVVGLTWVGDALD